MKPRILPFGEYLDAVERLYRVNVEEIASAAGVSAGEVRRWRRGTNAPTFRTVEVLTERFGGDARLVYLGVVLERFSRHVGCDLDEAATMPFSRRRPTPSRPRGRGAADRRQMSFLIE
jgi:transcriptional regulator with XRE-family HTH domain